MPILNNTVIKLSEQCWVVLNYYFPIIVCDTGVVFPNKPKTSHPKNRMYECKVCAIECNSEVMYQQHVQGVKHKKKVNRKRVCYLQFYFLNELTLFIICIYYHLHSFSRNIQVRNIAKLEDMKAGGDGTGKASNMAASILEK